MLGGAPDRNGLNLKLLTLLMVSALLIAVLINAALWWHDRDFRPLYGQGEHYNMAAIIELLDKQGIGYRVNPDSGQLMVRSGELAAARMAMAAGGVIPTVSRPWLPETSGLGSSHFVEQMQYLGALEESLSATISGIEAVRYARVHLSVPEQSVFFRNRPAAKASVYLELYSGMQLQPDQVSGIMRLVSGSVATLAEQEVTVVDQYGNLLSQSIAQALLSGNDPANHTYLSARMGIESHLELQLSDILDAVVGGGFYRVDVAVELTRDKIEQNSEQFDPDIVLRSESIESGVPFLLDKPAPITQSPTVPPAGKKAAEAGESDLGEQKVIRNYEVSRQISNETRYPGEIKRLTIAVVIDSGRLQPDTLKESEAQLTALIKQATGFDAERGDEVSLAILPFASVPPPLPSTDYKSIHRWLDIAIQILQGIILLAVCVLIILWCRRLLRSPPLPSGNGKVATPDPNNPFASSIPAEDLPGNYSPGSLEEQVARYQGLAENEPEKVAAVLKEWINRKRANG